MWFNINNNNKTNKKLENDKKCGQNQNINSCYCCFRFYFVGAPSKCKQQNELRPVKPTTTPQSHSVVNQGFPTIAVNTTQ